MQPQEIILWLTVLLIGVPSAWRNPTAAALVGAWIVTKVIYLVTGNALATEFYVYPDIVVITIIFCKPEYQPCDDYLSTWHQLKCLLIERTPADRVVLLIFPVEWAIYISTLPAVPVWWLLWVGSIIQFLAAGWESLSDFIRRRNADAANSPPHEGQLLVAYPAGGWSG